jgi:hypothetical protein
MNHITTTTNASGISTPKSKAATGVDPRAEHARGAVWVRLADPAGVVTDGYAGDGTERAVRSQAKLTPHQIGEAQARREAGETLADIGWSFNVSHSTISRLSLRAVLPYR